LLLHWPHPLAVGTSLLVVTANAVSGSLAYWRQGRIDLRTGWQFAVATLPGAVLGSYVVDLLSGRWFNTIFGIFLVVLSLYMLWRPDKPAGDQHLAVRPVGPGGWGWTTRRLVGAHGEVYEYAFSVPWGVALSFGVGFLSSILGIGGGIVHVPALITLFDFPAHVATATSQFILMTSAAAGSASHLALGNVVLAPGLAMALGAVLGAQVGGALSRRVHARWLVRALALALIVVGLRLVLG
jgi:uncharacterized membrane protein YfcA